MADQDPTTTITVRSVNSVCRSVFTFRPNIHIQSSVSPPFNNHWMVAKSISESRRCNRGYLWQTFMDFLLILRIFSPFFVTELYRQLSQMHFLVNQGRKKRKKKERKKERKRKSGMKKFRSFRSFCSAHPLSTAALSLCSKNWLWSTIRKTQFLFMIFV